MFLGALRILNYFNDPSEALGAALVGDSSHTDLSVGDIYGGAYQGIGLPADLVASSFGKLQKEQLPSQPEPQYKANVAKSMLTLVTFNALIIAKQLSLIEKIKNVVWTGAHVDIIEYMQMS